MIETFIQEIKDQVVDAIYIAQCDEKYKTDIEIETTCGLIYIAVGYAKDPIVEVSHKDGERLPNIENRIVSVLPKWNDVSVEPDEDIFQWNGFSGYEDFLQWKYG